MKDTQETNLPQAADKLEETKSQVETPATAADVVSNETEEAATLLAAGKLSKEEIEARLAKLVESPSEQVRSEVEALKQAYYKPVSYTHLTLPTT